ncbi:bifunctional adenosylcobinamide kinase/adenosylcobinamide-phosphate guanylyltransferase [Psychrobacter sp.]|uniref:bifunctional adenosylcobinamide kinase/adenosylcobinamide-phosphate guanylyltransferase n=1 Tax=Psychrobacter sp. TaxID=56811 RepID=UPI0025EB9E6B|nr:bifunctional adenosylcobinamide kinase/adenosylcobinamide-phosphate guanylyltransferase [Psychrobacter sp.]
MIHYITGGERSGKSSFAQHLAEKISESPYYLATARVLDISFAERVERHIDDRVQSKRQWTTIEADLKLTDALQPHFNHQILDSEQSFKSPTIVVDCVTLWLTNYVMDYDYAIDKCLILAKQEIDELVTFANQYNATVFIISNEIGMSLHASTPEGRKFVSLQGWVNQYLAHLADKATLVVSGLPVTLK